MNNLNFCTIYFHMIKFKCINLFKIKSIYVFNIFIINDYFIKFFYDIYYNIIDIIYINFRFF